jgi:hypothetical protein
MIKLSLIFAAFGLIGIGYFIGINDIAGQISCGVVSVFGIATSIAWNELNKHEETLKGGGRGKKRI